MSKFTPGPWYLIQLGSGRVSVDAKPGASDHEVVCVPSSDANGQLIAAAPEMLDALIELEHNARMAAAWMPHVLLITAVENAQKAIAKAGGTKIE